MKKTRSKKKIIISVLCVLLALAVLTPCVINAVVMLSASKYIISADEAAGRGADCVLVLGAKVNSNGHAEPYARGQNEHGAFDFISNPARAKRSSRAATTAGIHTTRSTI